MELHVIQKAKEKKKVAYMSAQLNKYLLNTDYVISDDIEIDKPSPHSADLV